MAIALRTQICDITSPYVYILFTFYSVDSVLSRPAVRCTDTLNKIGLQDTHTIQIQRLKIKTYSIELNQPDITNTIQREIRICIGIRIAPRTVYSNVP